MPQLYIPEIGDMLTLNEDWTFRLTPESRNEKMMAAYGYKYGSPPRENGEYGGRALSKDGENMRWADITLTKGMALKIDRIYIRKGKGEYSSITFYLYDPARKNKPRFFASLEDVRRIVIA